MDNAISSQLTSLRRYNDFLEQHADDIHRVLLRKCGTDRPVYCGRVGGLVRAMYPDEPLVAEFLGPEGHDAYGMTAAGTLANSVGALTVVHERPGYCNATWYRVNPSLPQGSPLLLEVYCTTPEDGIAAIKALERDVSFVSLSEGRIGYHYKPGEEQAAWADFDRARKVPGTVSNLSPAR